MSRCAIGWAPTKQAGGVDKVLSDLDSTDGLSPEQLDYVTGNRSKCVAPLSAQQLANSEAEAWAGEW